MNTMKQNGTTSVNIIELLDDSPKLISLSPSSPELIIVGSHDIVVKLDFTVIFVAKD